MRAVPSGSPPRRSRTGTGAGGFSGEERRGLRRRGGGLGMADLGALARVLRPMVTVRTECPRVARAPDLKRFSSRVETRPSSIFARNGLATN
jgi:hypothetical protein